MKALTILQPWASLVALGAKTIETRSWSTNYRGPLLIHAGARQVHHGKFFMLARIAKAAGAITPQQEAAFRAMDVPFGAVVATCTLADVVPILSPHDELPVAWLPHVAPYKGGPDRDHLALWKGPSEFENPSTGRPVWLTDDVEDQRPYGDFTPGRYAWLLADVRPLPSPIPAKGRQGLWTPSPEVLEAVAA